MMTSKLWLKNEQALTGQRDLKDCQEEALRTPGKHISFSPDWWCPQGPIQAQVNESYKSH